MSTYKNFAVAGPGGLGGDIIEELLKLKKAGKVNKIVVLTRTKSKNESLDRFAAQGATIVPVDYTYKAALTAALAGIDVVISTVWHSTSALDVQTPLAEAAQEAGVKLFVPSEFGHRTDRVAMPNALMEKADFQRKLREIGLPYALFWTGAFPDYILVPRLGFDWENGKVTQVPGDGNAVISFTWQPDVARYVSYVLSTLSPDRLAWRAFAIEGERKTFNEIFREYEEKSGRKLSVTYKPISEVKEAAKDPADFGSHIQLDWAQGGACVGKFEDLDVGEYPDWHPKKVVDVLLP